MAGRNRYDVELEPGQPGMYLRTGSFLKHPTSRLVVPHKTVLPFSRISKQLYFLFEVCADTFTLTTPYEDAYITHIDLKPGEKLFLKLDHVLGFTRTMFFQCAWCFDMCSIITKHFRYIYLTGPGRIILFGLGEVSVDLLSPEPSDYDQGAIIGWSGDVMVGVSSRSSLLSAAFAKESICLDRFYGNGFIITQASNVTKLPKRFHADKSNTSFMDYINALLGLRI